MCQICKNVKSRAQAHARDRVLKAERLKVARKIRSVARIFERKQIKASNYQTIYACAYSKHTCKNMEGRIGGDEKEVSFQFLKIPSDKNCFIKEKNVFYSFMRLNIIILLPRRAFYYETKGSEGTFNIVSSDPCVIFFPNKDELEFLREAGTEVSLN